MLGAKGVVDEQHRGSPPVPRAVGSPPGGGLEVAARPPSHKLVHVRQTRTLALGGGGGDIFQSNLQIGALLGVAKRLGHPEPGVRPYLIPAAEGAQRRVRCVVEAEAARRHGEEGAENLHQTRASLLWVQVTRSYEESSTKDSFETRQGIQPPVDGLGQTSGHSGVARGELGAQYKCRGRGEWAATSLERGINVSTAESATALRPP